MLRNLLWVSVLTYAACFAIFPKADREPTPTAPTVPPQTVLYAPVSAPTTVPATSTTTSPPASITTAHDAMQADLAVLELPADIPCQEWVPTALQAGWPAELLPQLLRVVWRESRCLNITDNHPKHNGGDTGPLQLNNVWRNEIAAQFGDEQLINDPYTNFAMGWEIYKWHEANRGCGWEPWRLPC